MASSLTSLPENLLDMLAVTSAPLASTAVRFTRAISDPAEYFNRALEILSSLEGDAGNPPGFDLNAEFVLYRLYREFGVRKNPFLTHWIGTCRETLLVRGASWSSSKGKGKENAVSSTDNDLMTRARLRLIYHILAGDGEKVGAYTPEEIYSNLDAFLPHKEVDISLFEMQTSSNFSDDDPFDANTPDPSGRDIRDLLSEAFERPLSTYERECVEKVLKRSAPVEIISAELLSGLISNNPSVATALATAVLSNQNSDKTEAGSNYSEAREYLLLTALPRLDVNLPTLEFLTHVIESGLLADEEYKHLLHLYLAQAVRKTEALDGGRNDRSDTKHSDAVISFHLQDITASGGDKHAQERSIRLLCLFVENMLRKRFINVDEYLYEIQDIGVRYIWVKEARTLWMKVNGNDAGRGG